MLYFEVQLKKKQVTTMTYSRNGQVGSDLLNNTPCDLQHACLRGSACNAEPFVDRDVPLLRCRDERACAFRRPYGKLSICTCPVNRASFGLN